MALEHRSNKLVGDDGEGLVEDELRVMGYEILSRNWRAIVGGRCVGELDIVARGSEGSLLVVEVKSRGGSEGMSSGGEFSPEGSFTPRKVSRMLLATDCYLQQSGYDGYVEFCLAAVDLRSCMVRFYRDIRL